MSTKTNKVSTTSRKFVTKGSKPTEKSQMTKNSITKSSKTIKTPKMVAKTTKSNQTWYDLKGYVGFYEINKTGMIRNKKTGYVLVGYGKNKDGYSLYNRNGERKIWYRSNLIKHQFGNI